MHGRAAGQSAPRSLVTLVPLLLPVRGCSQAEYQPIQRPAEAQNRMGERSLSHREANIPTGGNEDYAANCQNLQS